MLDLDELDRLYAAATRGEWLLGPAGKSIRVHDHGGMRVGLWPHVASFGREGDAFAVLALHNAYPALAAEVRAGRALRAWMRERSACTTCHFEVSVDTKTRRAIITHEIGCPTAAYDAATKGAA